MMYPQVQLIAHASTNLNKMTLKKRIHSILESKFAWSKKKPKRVFNIQVQVLKFHLQFMTKT